MKDPKPIWKLITLIIIIFLSWLIFPFLTFGFVSILTLMPLLILIIQICISLLYKNRNYLFLALLNPVVFCLIYYSLKPTINYLKDKPTILKCTYHIASEPSFDTKKSVFLDYDDDDCDWEGLYYYTLDINNFVTNNLIKIFGNPLKHKDIKPE